MENFDLIKYLAEGKLLKENKDEKFAYKFIDSESKKVKSLEEIPTFIAKLNKALFVDRNVRTLYDTSVRYDIADILKDNLGDILPEEIKDRLKDDATGAIEAIENNNSSFFTEYEEFNDDDEDDNIPMPAWYTKTAQEKIDDYIKNGMKGELQLNYSAGQADVKTLPDNLEVELDLYLPRGIISLPNNLKVGGFLGAIESKLTSLPKGLKVGRGLNARDSQLSSLPKDLQVGRDLDLTGTPLSKKYTKEEIKRMVPGVKGDILV